MSSDQGSRGQSANNVNAAPPEADGAAGDPDSPGIESGGGEFDFGNTPDPTNSFGGGGEPSVPTTDDSVGGGDDYGGGADYGTTVVERQADPSAPARGAYFDDADLDARIDALEGDEASLKKQASELRKRARGLRKRADKVD